MDVLLFVTFWSSSTSSMGMAHLAGVEFDHDDAAPLRYLPVRSHIVLRASTGAARNRASDAQYRTGSDAFYLNICGFGFAVGSDEINVRHEVYHGMTRRRENTASSEGISVHERLTGAEPISGQEKYSVARAGTQKRWSVDFTVFALPRHASVSP